MTKKSKPTEESDVELDDSTNDSNELSSTDELLESVTDSMPEVQPHAVEAARQEDRELLDSYSELVDKNGTAFSSDLHQTYKDGSPKLTGNGLLKIKPGSKNKLKSPSPLNLKSVQPKKEEPADVSNVVLGKTSANLLVSIGASIGGDEWLPKIDKQTGVNELCVLETAFSDYYKATGKVDLPPGLALTVAISMYALPRFTMPKTQSKMQKAKVWFVSKIVNFKMNKSNKTKNINKESSKKEE